MLRSDLHVHTRYCHGEGEPADYVREALKRGAASIGLLGHSRCTVPCHYGLSVEAEDTLYALTTQLKEQYQEQIHIFRGIELDYFCQKHDKAYDYRIGSVHFIQEGSTLFSVDSKREYLIDAIENLYCGDPRELVCAYYRSVGNVLNMTGADIVGHFDLISKFNEKDPFYDDKDPVIRQAALNAMEALVKQNPLFEINTGAISRGARTTPYPARWQLEALHEMGGRIILSSDAHHPANIFFQFGQSTALAKECGFTTAWELTPKGFCEYAL